MDAIVIRQTLAHSRFGFDCAARTHSRDMNQTNRFRGCSASRPCNSGNRHGSSGIRMIDCPLHHRARDSLRDRAFSRNQFGGHA